MKKRAVKSIIIFFILSLFVMQLVSGDGTKLDVFKGKGGDDAIALPAGTYTPPSAREGIGRIQTLDEVLYGDGIGDPVPDGTEIKAEVQIITRMFEYIFFILTDMGGDGFRLLFFLALAIILHMPLNKLFPSEGNSNTSIILSIIIALLTTLTMPVWLIVRLFTLYSGILSWLMGVIVPLGIIFYVETRIPSESSIQRIMKGFVLLIVVIGMIKFIGLLNIWDSTKLMLGANI
jgi:hypothetical protein